MKRKATIQPFATKKIMADNSNEEETRSQQTRQSTKKEIQRNIHEEVRNRVERILHKESKIR